MRILANFDRAIAETLQDKVKARLTFKVSRSNTLAELLPGRAQDEGRVQWQETEADGM